MARPHTTTATCFLLLLFFLSGLGVGVMATNNLNSKLVVAPKFPKLEESERQVPTGPDPIHHNRRSPSSLFHRRRRFKHSAKP